MKNSNYNPKQAKQINYSGISGEEKNKKLLILKKLSDVIRRLSSQLNRTNFYSKSAACNMQLASSFFYELINTYKVNLAQEYGMLLQANNYFNSNQISNGILIVRNLASRFKFTN